MLRNKSSKSLAAKVSSFAMSLVLALVSLTFVQPAQAFSGGLLASNTTLSQSNSPYVITSTIQIPEGITLTVEPGVQILNSTGQPLFYVHGTLNANGTSAEPIRIESNGTVVYLKNSPKTSQVTMKYTRVDGKGVASLVGATGYAQYANFILEDSDFVNLAWSYIWYPTSFSAKRNVFSNSAGLSIGFDGRSAATPSIENNLFLGSPNRGVSGKEYWIEAWASYGSTLRVTNNSFVGGPYTAVESTSTYDVIPLNAQSNYWGTTDESTIRAMVLDSEDGLDHGTRIDTSNSLSSPASGTPTALRYSAEPPAPVDSAGPQLVSFTATPSSVDTSSDNRTVTLSGRFTDATGSWYMAFRCGSVLRFLVDPDRSQFVDGLHIRDVGFNYLVAFKSTSGTNKDFSFVLEVPLNKNMSDESCTWTYSAIDDAGNRSEGSTGVSFGVTSTQEVDSAGPQLVSFTATPSSVDTSSDNRTVTLSGRFTDATGSWYMAFRCGSVLRFLVDPDRSQFVDGLHIRDVGFNYLVAFKSTSGTNKDFSFVLEVPLNKNMSDESCTWTYSAIDDAGNRSEGSTGVSFGVKNASDTPSEMGPASLISVVSLESEYSPRDLVSIKFKVQDSNLNPISNEEVTFTISPLWGFYEYRTGAAQTDNLGIATFEVKLTGAAYGTFQLTAVAAGIRTVTSFSVVRNEVEYVQGPTVPKQVKPGQLVTLNFTLLDKNREPVASENAQFTFPGLQYGHSVYTKNNNWSNEQGVVQAELQLSQAARGTFQIRIEVNGKTALAIVEVDAGETVLGETPKNDAELLVQRAGSQVFVTSEVSEGTFQIFEDDELVDTFVFDGNNQAHIVEQRLTGSIEIRRLEGGTSTPIDYETTRTLLWFQNVNLGLFSETNLGSSAREKVSNLVNHRYLESGNWKQRDSEVTKFICTGIYREGGSAAEKLSARKKAKLACESAKSLDNDPNSQVSFFYQTKPTKAASYVGKVLVTVKGIEPFVASRIN